MKRAVRVFGKALKGLQTRAKRSGGQRQAKAGGGPPSGAALTQAGGDPPMGREF